MEILRQVTGNCTPTEYWFEDAAVVGTAVPRSNCRDPVPEPTSSISQQERQQQQTAPPGVPDVTVQLLRAWIPFSVSETVLQDVRKRLQAEDALGADGALLREVLFLQFGKLLRPAQIISLEREYSRQLNSQKFKELMKQPHMLDTIRKRLREGASLEDMAAAAGVTACELAKLLQTQRHNQNEHVAEGVCAKVMKGHTPLVQRQRSPLTSRSPSPSHGDVEGVGICSPPTGYTYVEDARNCTVLYESDSSAHSRASASANITRPLRQEPAEPYNFNLKYQPRPVAPLQARGPTAPALPAIATSLEDVESSLLALTGKVQVCHETGEVLLLSTGAAAETDAAILEPCTGGGTGGGDAGALLRYCGECGEEMAVHVLQWRSRAQQPHLQGSKSSSDGDSVVVRICCWCKVSAIETCVTAPPLTGGEGARSNGCARGDASLASSSPALAVAGCVDPCALTIPVSEGSASSTATTSPAGSTSTSATIKEARAYLTGASAAEAADAFQLTSVEFNCAPCASSTAHGGKAVTEGGRKGRAAYSSSTGGYNGWNGGGGSGFGGHGGVHTSGDYDNMKKKRSADRHESCVLSVIQGLRLPPHYRLRCLTEDQVRDIRTGAMPALLPHVSSGGSSSSGVHGMSAELHNRILCSGSTPDVLLLQPLFAWGQMVHWVEAKVGMVVPGISAPRRVTALQMQLQRYVQEFGTGIVVWRDGYSDQIASLVPGVTHVTVIGLSKPKHDDLSVTSSPFKRSPPRIHAMGLPVNTYSTAKTIVPAHLTVPHSRQAYMKPFV
eukprot:TRINITY_DN810_c0_g1_i1.p1 TRINITY_DN810_c0_g1~~TRINITY_DN810_c0_g1_i1.p1  ORF type:complete len:785 (-),score=123.74 TRINITY_DN810_c0_g1_i1:526-2880(-)